MKHRLGMLLATTALMAVPAAAQDAAAAAQDAAGVLQAADRAIGASGVNSVLYTGTGTMRYVGQNYDSHDDWPKAPMTAYTATIDYPSKSSKEDWTVDLSKKDARGGGLPIPKSTDFVNGGTAWNINAQGQTNPQPGAAELRQFMITASPYGFIKAALASGNATLENRYFNRLDETVKVVGFTSGKYRFTGEFDKDNLLQRIVTWFPNPVMGDMQIEVRYTRLEGRRQRRQVPVPHSRPPGRSSAQRQRPQLVRPARHRRQGQRARRRGRGAGCGAQRGGAASPRRVAEAC